MYQGNHEAFRVEGSELMHCRYTQDGQHQLVNCYENLRMRIHRISSRDHLCAQ